MKSVVAPVLLSAIVVTACSSGGLPVGEYAAEVEALAAAYTTESATLRDQHFSELEGAVARLQSEFEGEVLVEAAVDETVRLSTLLLASTADALNRYVQDLDGLDAPRSISRRHEDYVRALDTAISGLAPVLTSLPDAVTFDDIDRTIASSGFADAQHRVVAACLDLERAIEAEGSAVNLLCEATR